MQTHRNAPPCIQMDVFLRRLFALLQAGYGVYWIYGILTLISSLFVNPPTDFSLWEWFFLLVLILFVSPNVVVSLPLSIGLWKGHAWALPTAFVFHVWLLFIALYRYMNSEVPFLWLERTFVAWHVCVIGVMLYFILRRYMQRKQAS